MKRRWLVIMTAAVLAIGSTYAATRAMAGRIERAPGPEALGTMAVFSTPPDAPAAAGTAPTAGGTSRGTVAAPAAVRVVEVTYTVQVTNRHATAASSNIRLSVPAAVSSVAGHQRVIGVQHSPEPAAREAAPAGERARYEIVRLAPGAVFTIQQTYQVELYGDAVLRDNAAAVDPAYLAPERGVESDNEEIQAAALAVTRNLTTAEAQATAILNFVVDHISYNGAAPSRNQGALAGFASGEGVCSEYAGLFVAMARAAGLPSRIVYGWAKDVPGPGFPTLDGQLDGRVRHAWAEYFDAGRGWVPVEPTFATVLPRSQRMSFDAANHLAQDFGQQALGIAYSGGTLAAAQATYMGNMPATRVVEVAAPAAAAGPTPGVPGGGGRPAPSWR